MSVRFIVARSISSSLRRISIVTMLLTMPAFTVVVFGACTSPTELLEREKEEALSCPPAHLLVWVAYKDAAGDVLGSSPVCLPIVSTTS